MNLNENLSCAIMFLNIQGFTPDANSAQYWKFDYLSNHIATADKFYPFIGLTETWLKPKNSDAQVEISNYNIHRSDRMVRDRGGALLYVHETIPVTKIEKFDDDMCEAVIVQSSPLQCIVACIYKPCDATDTSFAKLISFLQEFISNTVESDKYTTIMLGDFNFPSMWKAGSDIAVGKSKSEKKLLNFMNSNFLCQYIDKPTRNQNILDLFLCNNDRLVQHVLSEKHAISDHNLVEVTIPHSEMSPKDTKLTSSTQKKELHGFYALDLHNVDYTEIALHLSEIDWEKVWIESGLEEFPTALHQIVLEACQKNCPRKSSKSYQYTSHQRSYHTILRKKRKLTGRLNCLKELKPSSSEIPKLEGKVNQLLTDLKQLSSSHRMRNELKAISKIISNPKYFYTYAKRLAKTKHGIPQLFKDNDVVTDRKEVADILQDQFCSSFSDPACQDKQLPLPSNPSASLGNISLTIGDIISAIDEINASSSSPDFSIPAIVLKNCKHELSKPLLMMWQESFNTGKIPSSYKFQLISPVYKKGSRSLPPNYRPVSLTAHEIKVFERVLRKKMVEFLESNHLLTCKQHGFRKGRSCLSQLLKQYDDILLNLLNQSETDVIYLDFAKAFDKVDHEILVRKLKNIGIGGKLLEWICDFLCDREQVVVVDNVFSYIAKVVSGVPQGTVLGPILFLIYLNDLSGCLNSCDFSCFADDTRIYKAISSSEETSLLQQDLYAVSKWSKDNNMKLHSDKFKYVNFNLRSNKFPLANLPFFQTHFEYTTSEGNSLEPDCSVKDLGVSFSENLDWSYHTSSISKKAKQKAGWVLSAFSDRSPMVMKTLYKSVIRSHVEYCCPLWTGLSMHQLRDIEAIQRSFSNKILCPPSVTNYWERLQFLNLMSLQRRRERYTILHIWKITNFLVSNDLNINFYESPRFGIMAHVPPITTNSNSKAKTLYDHSFAVIGPRLWNLVPKKVKEAASLFMFKCRLDEFLKTIPDRPPVHGYVCQNNNSLLEWCISQNA